MNRRSFFSYLAAFAGAASLSPNIFIPKFEPVKWKVIAPPKQLVSCAAFTQFLVDQQPVYDIEILKNMQEAWIDRIPSRRFELV